MISVDVDINENFFKDIKLNVEENVKNELIDAIEYEQIIPYDTGATQQSLNNSKIEGSKIVLKNTTPYASKIYNENNFKRVKNKNATGQWFNKFFDRRANTVLEIVQKSIIKFL